MKKILKRLMAVILSIGILVSANITGATAATQQQFKDVKTTDWYYNDVMKLAELNLTSGAGNGMYKPQGTVTRAEFITFMCRVMGYQPSKNSPFVDVSKHWAEGYITIALANNIISLPANKKFRPNDAITRQETVEIMCKAFNINQDLKTKSPYTDVTSNTGYTTAAYENYLMRGSDKNGKTYFYPGNKLTRGEVAKVIVNAYDYHTDKIAFLNKAIAAENEKAAAQKAEAEKYQAWLDSIDKNVNPELLKDTTGLDKKMTPYESHQYLHDVQGDYLKNWGADYKMTPEEFEKEMVRVGTEYANLIANVNYKNIDAKATDFKKVLESNNVHNYLPEFIEYIKNKTVVSEGKFYTGTGMLLFGDWGNPLLRGTLRYKYSAPTSKEGLKKEIVGSTKKPSELNTWYEQDFYITFAPEKDGLKVTRLQPISEIRIAKKGV